MNTNRSKKLRNLVVYGVPVLVAAILKTLVWSPDITPFNADEAIVALMARHINQGELMSFFYGQSYMGSLDAILISILYRLFGESIFPIRLLQSVMYLGTVLTTAMIARRILKSSRGAFYAGMIAALPPVNVVLYSTVSLGGYGEMLLIGNLLLLGGIGFLERIGQQDFVPRAADYTNLFVWGLGAGFGFWVIGLSLVYTIPMIGLIFWKLKKTGWRALVLAGLSLLAGGILGSSPWWLSALTSRNLAVLAELSGSAIAGANQGIWILQPLQRLLSLIVFGGTVILGLRPPWSIRWLMLPLLPLILVFWMAVLFDSAKKHLKELTSPGALPALMALVLAAGFIFTPYGDDPSGRYFLPLIIPMAVYGADLILSHLQDRRIFQSGILVLILAFNVGGVLQARSNVPPGITTQFDPVAQIDHTYLEDLVDFLDREGITTGYSNYWVSYPVAFLSAEEIVFSPRLPYHLDFRYTARDDRYLPYTELVDSADQIAYITTRHPPLDDYLIERFKDRGITWEEQVIGDYKVYFRLSEPIHVWDIGLGETTNP